MVDIRVDKDWNQTLNLGNNYCYKILLVIELLLICR